MSKENSFVHSVNIRKLICNKITLFKLKADRLHPHDYSTHRQTPWTDNDSSFLFSGLYFEVKWFSHERGDQRTDGRYQVHYLPRFAVDNEGVSNILITSFELKK